MKIQHPFWFSLYNFLVIPILYVGLRVAWFFNRKIKQGIRDRRGLFQKLEQIKQDHPAGRDIVVIHCASAGEFEAAKPLIVELHRRKPELLIHVTCYSPSGMKPISHAEDIDSYSYLPFDDFFSARRFFNILKPAAFLIIKHDIWPNMVWAAVVRGIPSIWINANLHKETKRLSFMSRGLNRSFLGELTAILTMGESHAERLANLVSPLKINITGDSRYDRTLDRMEQTQGAVDDILPAAWFEDKKVIIGGSTWGPDQRIMVPAFAALKKNYPDLYLILVPHEPHEEFLADTDYYLRQYNLRSIRLSQLNGSLPTSDVLVVDRVGILAALYRISWAAYIGGAFGDGVHSVLEPAVYGVPLFFGPKYYMAHEAQSLVQRGGAISVTSPEEFERSLREYLTDQNGWQYASEQTGRLVQTGAGATERIIDIVERELNETNRTQ